MITNTSSQAEVKMLPETLEEKHKIRLKLEKEKEEIWGIYRKLKKKENKTEIKTDTIWSTCRKQKETTDKLELDLE